jgi:hypothetical protein
MGTVLLVGALIIAGCSGDSDGEGACLPGVTVDGKRYAEVPMRGLERSDALSMKGISVCSDTFGPGSESDSSAIALVSLKGVDTRIAVAAARPGPGGGVYVIEGRCYGFNGARQLTDCIENPVQFDGDLFVGMKLGRPLTTEGAVGVGTNGSGRPVRVWKITNVPVEYALAINQEPRQIYVGVNRCNLPLAPDFEDKLIQCLSSQSK